MLKVEKNKHTRVPSQQDFDEEVIIGSVCGGGRCGHGAVAFEKACFWLCSSLICLRKVE